MHRGLPVASCISASASNIKAGDEAAAARAGISLNQYIAIVLAAHVGPVRERHEQFWRGRASSGGLGWGIAERLA